MWRWFRPKISWKNLDWRSVTRIDAARVPTPVVDNFCILLYSHDTQVFQMCSCDNGFAEFEQAVWQEWPEIKSSLTAVHMGPPDVAEHVTVWRQRERY
jgi:hypothetical protein